MKKPRQFCSVPNKFFSYSGIFLSPVKLTGQVEFFLVIFSFYFYVCKSADRHVHIERFLLSSPLLLRRIFLICELITNAHK